MDLEDRSGIQLVVATVGSLEGQEIEPYANELFRTWRLGEADKDNGVLLLVAPNECRVRIEVGYGLEGTLTDALSKVIIANAITPRFKAGDFSGGVTRGVDDIITVLTTDASEWEARPTCASIASPRPVRRAGCSSLPSSASSRSSLSLGASAVSSATCSSASCSVRAAAGRADRRVGATPAAGAGGRRRRLLRRRRIVGRRRRVGGW